MVRAHSIEDLELPLGWLEPPNGIALEDHREAPLGVRIELLQPIQAAREAAEQQLADLGLVSWFDPVILN